MIGLFEKLSSPPFSHASLSITSPALYVTLVLAYPLKFTLPASAASTDLKVDVN